MQIDLTFYERNLLLAALRHKPFHDSIALPKTQRVVRDTYKAVRDKLKGMAYPDVQGIGGQEVKVGPEEAEGQPNEG